MQTTIWNRCIQALQTDLSEQQINTWIRPLQPVEDANGLRLIAPNRFIVEWVTANCKERIDAVVAGHTDWAASAVLIEVDNQVNAPIASKTNDNEPAEVAPTPG